MSEQSYFLRLTIIPFLGALLAVQPALGQAADPAQTGITIELGDYQFRPNQLEAVAGRPIELTLVNTDGVTPHNFTLKDTSAGLDVSINVPAGKTTTIELNPAIAGNFTFYCDKKLLFMKSHRKRGMEGTLHVRPAAER